MTTTINADNGVSSGSAGLKSSADNSGVLQLQTNGTAAVTVDTLQNVGIGVTPTVKLDVNGAIQAAQNNYVKVGNAYMSSGGDYLHLNTHAYYNGSAWVGDGTAGVLFQGAGQAFNWYKGSASTSPAYTQLMSLDSNGTLLFNSGYGSIATAYGCRAWVNFDGTTASPSTIRGSGNVTSVTKNGTGDYTVNFTTTLVDTNYAWIMTCDYRKAVARNVNMGWDSSSQLTTSIRVYTFGLSTGIADDFDTVQVTIFR